MKKFLLATTVAVAALSTGFAVSAQDLTANIRAQIMQYVPDADLSNLTPSQVAELNGIFANSDNLSSGSNPSGMIMQVLDGSSARSVSQVQLTSGQKDQIRQAVPTITDAQLENLSTSQMARLNGLWSRDSTMTQGDATVATLKEILTGAPGTQLSSIGLKDSEKATITGLVPEANLAVLTADQVAQLTTLLSDTSKMADPAAAAARIREVLGL